MRSDMFKIIVERPRRGRTRTGSDYPRGHLKNVWSGRRKPDFEAAPCTESMGGHYAHKELNENLAPLVRFLRANVGRPWNKVRSEIAAQLSCKSAVQKHVFDHLRGYVKQDVRLDGKVVLAKEWHGYEPLVSQGGWMRFYVCPRTGLLRLAPLVARKRPPAASPGDRRILSPERELRLIAGLWYEVALAVIPATEAARQGCCDVVENIALGSAAYQARAAIHPLWLSGRYAVSKRQLNGREIARYGLRRDAS